MKSPFINTLTTLLTTAALLLTPAQAQISQADQVAIRQLAARLADTERAYSGRGWFVHDFEPSFLEAGEFMQVRIWLDAGDEIIFRGMGDSDARDIDLIVFGPNGREVVRDVDLDATPLATFTARRSGHFIVRLSLVECWANGSYVALLVAQK